MTYNLNFEGNLQSHDEEAEVLELAKKFAKDLEKHGLLSSNMRGTHIGTAHNLTDPELFNPNH